MKAKSLIMPHNRLIHLSLLMALILFLAVGTPAYRRISHNFETLQCRYGCGLKNSCGYNKLHQYLKSLKGLQHLSEYYSTSFACPINCCCPIYGFYRYKYSNFGNCYRPRCCRPYFYPRNRPANRCCRCRTYRCDPRFCCRKRFPEFGSYYQPRKGPQALIPYWANTFKECIIACKNEYDCIDYCSRRFGKDPYASDINAMVAIWPPFPEIDVPPFRPWPLPDPANWSNKYLYSDRPHPKLRHRFPRRRKTEVTA